METKDQIIKALRLCAESVTEEFYPCDKCPYSDIDSYVESCSSKLKRDAAELIESLPDKLIIKKREDD